jgi:hypothetical protein
MSSDVITVVGELGAAPLIRVPVITMVLRLVERSSSALDASDRPRITFLGLRHHARAGQETLERLLWREGSVERLRTLSRQRIRGEDHFDPRQTAELLQRFFKIDSADVVALPTILGRGHLGEAQCSDRGGCQQRAAVNTAKFHDDPPN